MVNGFFKKISTRKTLSVELLKSTYHLSLWFLRNHLFIDFDENSTKASALFFFLFILFLYPSFPFLLLFLSYCRILSLRLPLLKDFFSSGTYLVFFPSYNILIGLLLFCSLPLAAISLTYAISFSFNGLSRLLFIFPFITLSVLT